MPRKKVATKRDINKALNAIYKDPKGKKMNMKVKRAPKSGGKRILIGLIVFFALLAVVSWLGILFFSKFTGGESDNLKLQISGDKKVDAGQEISYEVIYKNNEDTPIASADIELYLPKSFVLVSTEPTLSDKNTLKLGSLKSGEGGTIKFKGRFFATEGDVQMIQVVLNYKPSNFNATFEKVSDLEVKITGSDFDGSLDGPDKIIIGEEVKYILIYKNKSNKDLEKVAIDLDLPDDFVIATSTPALGRADRWDIGRLEAKSEGEVEIVGSFGVEAKGDRDIIFKLGVLDDDSVLLSLVEKTITTDVIGGDFSLGMLVNGANNFNTARWGDVLNYSLVFKNKGNEALHGIEVKLKIAGLPKEKGESIVDWESLGDPYGGKVEGDVITWTGSEIPKLEKLKPGDEGLIDFSINIIKKPVSMSYRDYKIDAFLESSISRVGDVAVRRTLQAPKVTVFIDSDTSFSSSARYYSEANAVIGSGPIPPKVGQATTYKIFWNVTNSMHELEDMEISGLLPDNVVFKGGNANAGEIALDDKFKNVVWSLNRLPTSVGSVSAEFSLTLTPEAGDVGNIVSVLEAIEFKAKDKSTGGIIKISGGDETTQLPDDSYVSKGEVER